MEVTAVAGGAAGTGGAAGAAGVAVAGEAAAVTGGNGGGVMGPSGRGVPARQGHRPSSPPLGYYPMVIGARSDPFRAGPKAHQFIPRHPLELCLHVREVPERIVIPN